MHDQNDNFRKFNMADGRHFEHSFISISQPWIIRFRSNLVYRYKFLFRACKFDKEIEILQIQDGGRTPYWKSFFYNIDRHIDRLMRNLDQKYIITCQYRAHEQNGNFRKFKMADGRHFENSFTSISEPWIIQFRSNLVHRYKFPFRAWKFDKKSKFFKWKMGVGRRIENVFVWQHLGATLTD